MERYEAVVVGAGPAGSAAALELAKHGVQVLVLERGKQPGSKNVTGGILYGQTDTPYNLDHLVPGFEREAPLERRISQYWMHAVAGDRVATLDLRGLHGWRTKWAYSVLRVPFDRWFAERADREARKHSGGVLSGVTATGPLLRDGRIVGVECEEIDPIRADLVVAADGATSEMARKAGLWDWAPSAKWFQGVKVVLRMPAEEIEQRFGVQGLDGAAHLFAGDLFGGARGGGFLYTNKETLSVGTVFHLDSLERALRPARERFAAAGPGGDPGAHYTPHELLDNLLAHPSFQELVGGGREELEYSAKLIPDGKRFGLRRLWKERLLVCGDAAGQMWASGPIIKGMNLGITAGILAAQAYLEAKASGKPHQAGPRYEAKVRRSYVWRSMHSLPVALGRALAQSRAVDAVQRRVVGRLLRARSGAWRAQRFMNSPRLAASAPDTEFVYVELPSIVARAHGRSLAARRPVPPRSLDDRIGALKYDTAVGKPHIVLLDDSLAASGRAVHTCPVSSPRSSRGCYRVEEQRDDKGNVLRVVAFDVQPCIECGTCAIEARTRWTHPPGGKGVEYEWG